MIKKNVPLALGESIRTKAKYIKWLVLHLVFARKSYRKLSTRSIDHAITSGQYLQYSFSQGRYEDSAFLNRLRRLQVEIALFENMRSAFNINDILHNDDLKGNGEDFITIFSDDFLLAISLLSCYENVVSLSTALLAYLMGNTEKLGSVVLNSLSPSFDEEEKFEAETPSEDEIIAWALGD